MGGARRDERKSARQRTHLLFRDEFGQWDPKNQRPELWSLYNTRLFQGENMRVFPISNWTELDIWQYIAREKLALPPIYYTHKREVVERNGLLVPVTPLTPKREGELPKSAMSVSVPSAIFPAPALLPAPPPRPKTSLPKLPPRPFPNAAPHAWTTAYRKRQWKSAKNKAISKPFFQTAPIYFKPEQHGKAIRPCRVVCFIILANII